VTTSTGGVRTVLVPDLDDELLATLRQVEELLLLLSGDDLDDELRDVPEPIAHDQALNAVRRLWDALRPTRRPADAPRSGQLLAPDGRYEHIPLTPIELNAGDVSVLGATARVLAAASPTSVLGEALDEASGIGPHKAPTATVESVARLHGVLDLELTDDTRLLLPRLRASLAGDIVLTPAEDPAYNRTVDRINTMWSGSVIDRWAY
jgi:hypothetical protein